MLTCLDTYYYLKLATIDPSSGADASIVVGRDQAVFEGCLRYASHDSDPCPYTLFFL